MKKYEFTEADREEVLRLLGSRSWSGARNYIQQLKEIQEVENSNAS